MRALVLAIAVASSPAAAATPGPSRDWAPVRPDTIRPAPRPADLPEGPPPAAAKPQERADVAQPRDRDVLEFLNIGHAARGNDASLKLDWGGPGAAQLRLSWDALDRRNKALAEGDGLARAIVEMYYASEGADPDDMKKRLAAIVGGPLEQARAAYLEAVSWEERRLFFVEKALAEAEHEGAALPGVDAALVTRRLSAIRSGAVRRAVGAQLDGYRDLALGLVGYLDGDSFGALQRVRASASALPEFAVAHAFLGSLYFLFDQKDAAIASWRRANELDPSDPAVKQALMEYGRTTKQALKNR